MARLGFSILSFRLGEVQLGLRWLFLVPASLIPLGYSWFLKISRNLAVLILAFATIVHILWAKQNGMFLNGWFFIDI